MRYDKMSKHLNINLEALRGYAALFVVLGHLLALGHMFNPAYKPTITVVFAPSAHLFLLVFFVLSGYVIAASNRGLYTSHQILSYLWKRFIRIYPIYFIALITTLIIAGFHYSPGTIFWNFTLLQALMVPQFLENGPTWSLHFEVLFYLLFIPVAFFRLNLIMVFVLALAIALVNFYFYPNIHTPIISSYLFGFTFWVGGACLAKYLSKREIKVSYNILLSTIFFMLAVDQMVLKSGLPEVVNYWAYHIFHQQLIYPPGVDGSKIVMRYTDLAFLPYCLYAVLIFSGQKIKYEKLYFILLVLPLLYSLVILTTEKKHLHLLSFSIPVTYFIISLLLRFADFSFIKVFGAATIKFGAWLGSISYGIYIIHAPLIFLLGKVNISDNQIFSYVTKVILLIALVLASGFVLEKIFQPWVKSLLSAKKSVEDKQLVNLIADQLEKHA